MTDDELHSVFHDVGAFLLKERTPDANVEPVSAEEQHQVTRVFAGGRCNQCGRLDLHLHPEPADG